MNETPQPTMQFAKQEVRLIDWMGGDLSVVNDARVSFDVLHDALTTGDVRLIQFLARGCTRGDWSLLLAQLEDAGYVRDRTTIGELLQHWRNTATHWTPFGGSIIKLYIKTPVAIARQFVRSEAGRVYNEMSRRYVSKEPEFLEIDHRLAPTGGIKQGSQDARLDVREDGTLGGQLRQAQATSLDVYHKLIEKGVAPEVARFYLPQNVMTEMRVTGSLCYWARVVKLRSDPHAQREVQYLAHLIDLEICSLSNFHISWNALKEW